MAVKSIRVTEYIVECDICGLSGCGCLSALEDVHNKTQAIKWADMHNTKIGILCDTCFEKYKISKRKKNN